MMLRMSSGSLIQVLKQKHAHVFFLLGCDKDVPVAGRGFLRSGAPKIFQGRFCKITLQGNENPETKHNLSLETQQR